MGKWANGKIKPEGLTMHIYQYWNQIWKNYLREIPPYLALFIFVYISSFLFFFVWKASPLPPPCTVLTFTRKLRRYLISLILRTYPVLLISFFRPFILFGFTFSISCVLPACVYNVVFARFP